ncbi:hypothetical protein KUF88_06205 [Streptococcus equi subsp. zooepidemicus]|uniref:hypothetical protein n=1 Tax=Streptococcus equi TaxID=1336 RepID=UPI0012AEC449|nr:hypothetical protein [Streptococcus equi]MCD3374329.1 hypothetical protein [Streptococcus equi subsp. zooepidemicus]WOK56797.1 hypothetical protein RIM63_07905 [Streptococcus equi subsp. zooepidemicus]HEL0606077.1 hypothetical protein [Streptococcus equi subsp. zooepidemicus]HEL0727884.1 hypothetical protein [Streptococcus equi subsp. zooepidemicus]HEL1078948.1 hypothetical protein [Streptococcus equi subsp. zooepidemicus]
MEQLKKTTELLGIKNTIQLLTVLNPHRHIVSNPNLDYSAPLCPKHMQIGIPKSLKNPYPRVPRFSNAASIQKTPL